MKKISINESGKYFKDSDDLNLGNCVCVLRNRYTNVIRLANGSVENVPYKKDASLEIRKKYGKHMVYVIYYQFEDIVGYYQ